THGQDDGPSLAVRPTPELTRPFLGRYSHPRTTPYATAGLRGGGRSTPGVHPVAPLEEAAAALHAPCWAVEAEGELGEAHRHVAGRVLRQEPLDVVRLDADRPLDLVRVASDRRAVGQQRLDRRLDLLHGIGEEGVPGIGMA